MNPNEQFFRKRIHHKGLTRAGAGVLLASFPERFIQKVLHNVDRQHVSVDNLTPHDLDQLSRLIVDALQVVDQDQGPNRGLARVRPGPRDLGGQLTGDEEDEGGENEEEERSQENRPVTPADRQGDFLLYTFSSSSPEKSQTCRSRPKHMKLRDGAVLVFRVRVLTDVSLFVPTERHMDQDLKVSAQSKSRLTVGRTLVEVEGREAQTSFTRW